MMMNTVINIGITVMSKSNLLKLLLPFLLFSCSIAPGMSPIPTGFDSNVVYIEESDISVPIVDLDIDVVKRLSINDDQSYYVSAGDVLSVTVWGQDEAFPMLNYAGDMNPYTARTVDTNGTIFFPYVGQIKIEGLSIEEVRNKITLLLSGDFINPQVDVTIIKFNRNRTIYLLGEFVVPQSFILGIEPMSLSDAIGEAKGFDNRTARANEIFIVRGHESPVIYKVNLENPAQMLIANRFYLEPRDVIYVAPVGVTRWNRIISQIFPFASFLNQIDNIATN